MLKKLFIILSLFFTLSHAQETGIDLTQEEKDFIKDHPTVVLGSSSEFSPYVIVEKNGDIVGFDADVLNEINQLTGMNFSLKVGNWKQMQDEAKADTIDGLSTGIVTKERAKYLNFSDVYTSVQIMVMTHIDNTSIKTLQDLEGKKIAVSRHIVSHKKAASVFKNATILEYDNVAEVMNSVITGESDAMFGRSSLLYTSSVSGAPYLKLVIPLDSTLDLTFAVNKKFPLAISIINKALKHIGKNQLLKLQNKWFLIQGNVENIDLTQEEQEYLQENSITYAGDPDWLPFEAFDKNGNYLGIIADHMTIIENRLNIKFEKVITKSWLDTLALSKTKKVDVISGDAADVVLNQNYKPIATYIQNPLVIVTAKDHEYILDLHDIKDKKIAFISGAGYSADIVKKYPDIEFLECETSQLGLLGVKTGKYDAFIGSLYMVEYTVVSMGIEDIKIAGQTDIMMDLTLFVNKNKPLLYSILNKAMKTISENKQHGIISKWRKNKVERVIDYALLWQILTVFLILFLIGLSFLLMLRKNNKKLNLLLNSTIDAIGIFKDGKLIESNDVFLELYGYNSLYEIKNKHVSDFVHKDHHQFLKNQLKDTQKPYEMNLIKKDGTVFPALIRGTNIDDHTRVSSAVDMTELKNAERELEELNRLLEERVEQEVEKNRKQQMLMMQKNRLAQMGEMLNSIAHQWRQPLNSINSNVAVMGSVLAKETIDQKILQKQMEKIENNTQYMSNTIEDFSNFFRPNKLKKEFIVQDTLKSALELLAPRSKDIEINIMQNQEIKLCTFKEEYQQVVMIILNNAIDNFDSKSIETPTITIVIAEDKYTSYLSICDNGGGIDKENIDRIYDPYFTTKFAGEGVGLGLYIAKMLIEDSMQGKLEAANKNEGICFEISIPKEVEDA